MIIFCDEVQAPSDFSYTTSCRCWHTCAPVWTNFGWMYRQGGGVSASTTCSVAVIEVHQPNILSLDFKFAPTTSLRTDLRRPVQDPSCLCYFPRNYVHVVCDRSMWVAGISISHEHVPTNKSDLRGERPRGYSRRQGKKSTALQLAATSAWPSVSTSGQEIT
jgi:hypothetical protein